MIKKYKNVTLICRMELMVDDNLTNERILDIFGFVRADLEKVHLQVAHGHELAIRKLYNIEIENE